MFTRDSVIISNNIKTPLTALSKAVGNIFLQLTYSQLIKSLFSNNEVGFAYDPNDLTTLYQDAAGTIPVTAVGQPVGLMLDKSGRNNHAYQTVSASRPILQRNATTGAYYLAFDGADDFLQTNSINFTSTDKVSLFAGVRKLSDAAVGIVVELSNSGIGNSGAFTMAAPNSTLTPSYNFRSRGSVENVIIVSSAPYAAPISSVLVGRGNIASDFAELRINSTVAGTSSADQGTGNYGNYPLYIGRRGGASLPFNGHLYSLIGIGRLTTDSETIALEKSIAKNTGVTL